MMLPFITRPLARRDIDEAYDWYELQQIGRGDDFLQELHQRLLKIQQNPHHYGRIRGDVRAAPLHNSNYIVYYRIETKQVTILAVQHTRAHPGKWKRRK